MTEQNIFIGVNSIKFNQRFKEVHDIRIFKRLMLSVRPDDLSGAVED